MTIEPHSEPNLPEIDPEAQGVRYWYERYCEQQAEIERLKQRVKELEEQFESLNKKFRKLSERSSETSSQPPASDGVKKPNRDQQTPSRQRGPKYNHPGKTRNGFGWVDHGVLLIEGQVQPMVCPPAQCRQYQRNIQRADSNSLVD